MVEVCVKVVVIGSFRNVIFTLLRIVVSVTVSLTTASLVTVKAGFGAKIFPGKAGALG